MEEEPFGGPALLTPSKISFSGAWSCCRDLHAWQEPAAVLPLGSAGSVPPTAMLCCTTHRLLACQNQPRNKVPQPHLAIRGLQRSCDLPTFSAKLRPAGVAGACRGQGEDGAADELSLPGRHFE